MMKRKLIGAACGLLVATASAVALAAESWSPNALPTGECTWWVDGRAKASGWQLQFSRDWNRHAALWTDLVTNGRRQVWPGPGSIVVLAPWAAAGGYSANPWGHVMFVESNRRPGPWSRSTYWVSHANMSGRYVGSVEGRRINVTRAEFSADGSRVRLLDSKLPYREYVVKGVISAR